MQLTLNKKIITIVIGSIIAMITIISSVYAVGAWYEGYRVNAGTLGRINLRAVYNDCKDVTAAGNHIFIPTRSIGEWNNFKAVAPGLGIAVNPCPTTTVPSSNVDQQWGAHEPLYATCPGGTHVIGGSASPYYPGAGWCMGNWIWIGSVIVTDNIWGNGWTADFQTAGADATGNQYIYDNWYGNGWVATDGYCGGGTLTVTCEYD